MNHRKIFRRNVGLVGFVALLVIVGACDNNGKRHVDEIVNPNSLYFDYKIWGDEESGIITLNLQYRPGGSEGTPVKISTPGKVTLDGYRIEPDSSKMNGVYYEVNIPVQDFDGPHEIIYTDAKGREYKESFEFPLISLKTELPKTLVRDDLNFELAGLDTLDFVRIIFTDTSFYGRGECMDFSRICFTRRNKYKQRWKQTRESKRSLFDYSLAFHNSMRQVAGILIQVDYV